VDRRADANEGPSTTVTPAETPNFGKKQLEGPSGEKASGGNTSQKTYLRPSSFGLRKKDSGGTVPDLHPYTF
jgi:hypothetical protein